MWRTAGVVGENTAILTAAADVDVLLLGRGFFFLKHEVSKMIRLPSCL
jgi:hypothetical protein